MSIDTSRALRTSDELNTLVEAVRDAPAGEPETDNVEWKSDWNITDASVRFETVRHILGFGNRTIFAAQQSFEGCAYLLAGVEPGNLVGAPIVDPAEIDDQLSKYILPGQPRWSPSYVTVDGKPVLIFTIEAPRGGDPIFVLQKGYDRAPAGRIFVRRHGKTEEAGPADIRALEARGQAVRPEVELIVERRDDLELRAGRFVNEHRDQWVRAEMVRVLGPLEPKPERPRSAPDAMIGGYDLPSRASLMPEDMRSKKSYSEDVEAYVEAAPRRWLALVAAESVRKRLAPIRLAIVNSTERNFEGVEVVLDLPDKVAAWLSEEEPFDVFAAPTPPKEWGQVRLGDFTSDIDLPTALSVGQQDEIERRGDGRRVRLAPRHVRPGERVELPAVYVTLPSAMAGKEVQVRWRLTSTGVDGWQEGDVVFAVESEPVDLEQQSEEAS